MTPTNQRLDLILEIEQIPEQYIPELLQVVRLFRERQIARSTSVNAWNDAIAQIGLAVQKKMSKG